METCNGGAGTHLAATVIAAAHHGTCRTRLCCVGLSLDCATVGALAVPASRCVRLRDMCRLFLRRKTAAQAYFEIRGSGRFQCIARSRSLHELASGLHSIDSVDSAYLELRSEDASVFYKFSVHRQRLISFKSVQSDVNLMYAKRFHCLSNLNEAIVFLTKFNYLHKIWRKNSLRRFVENLASAVQHTPLFWLPLVSSTEPPSTSENNSKIAGTGEWEFKVLRLCRCHSCRLLELYSGLVKCWK